MIALIALLVLALAWGGLPCVAAAQSLVHGTVVADESGSPIAGVLVRALRSRRSDTTDRFGRFSVWVELPDTLVSAFIGRRPDTLALSARPVTDLRIRSAASPVALSDIIVTTPATSGDLELGDVGGWRLSREAVRSLPPAVEPDLFRSLALVPAVSFTTPLSARPIVRGYDASESGYRIDGFEVLNLYHIGRVFSAFPGEAAEQVSVSIAPAGARHGGSLAGTVDIVGRAGSPDATHGGANLSLMSASSWIGGGSGLRSFGAARAVHVAVLNEFENNTIPYDFQDFYGSALLTDEGDARGRLTVFASRDHVFDRDLGSGMDWSNLLLGVRGQLVRAGSLSLEASASGTRFSEDVVDVPARRSRIDVRNRFSRLGGGVDLGWQSPRSRVSAGLTAGGRLIANRIAARSGDEFAAVDVDLRRSEFSAYGEWSHAVGSASLQLGLRVDLAGSTHVWQPRGEARLPLADGLTLGVALGRTGRLYHLVSESRPEPDLAFYDFWLSAGEGGVPVPIVDHLSTDLDFSAGTVMGRMSAFASTARGLVELRPVTEQATNGSDQFRYGEGRTWGLEAQIAMRSAGARPSSLSLAYVLSTSERRWQEGWVPWAQDRRHLARLLGKIQLGRRWSVAGAIEAASGAPLTAVDQVVTVGVPDPANGATIPPRTGFPAYVFGPENAARSAGTVRADFNATYEFRGPGRSRMWAGVSVVNVGFGPVAPLVPSDPTSLIPVAGGQPATARVNYERLFDLPAVPTVTLRIEF